MFAHRPFAWTLTVGFLFSLSYLAAPIAAQTSPCIIPDGSPEYEDSADYVSPTGYISPGGGTYASASRSVTINFSDERELRGPTIKLNGTSANSSFRTTYTGSPATSGQSTGTVTLRSGSNTLWTRICDAAMNCIERSASYYYDPTKPTVSSISPSGGTYTGASRGVTIKWADNYRLNGATQYITLNGSDVTSRFTFGGGTTSAQSTGTVYLSHGTNTLWARIRDTAGSWSTAKSVTYTYNSDPTPPTVEIIPEHRSGSNLWVRIQWCDNQELKAGTQRFILNGQELPQGDFDYEFGWNDKFGPQPGCDEPRESEGYITLRNNEDNTFRAEIRDWNNNPGRDTYGYFHDAASPSVTIRPGSGVVANEPLEVIIEWCDNRSLKSSTRSIKIADEVMPREVTGQFSYTPGTKDGCGEYAVSRGTLMLYSDSTTLTASIKDDAKNPGSQPATYILDNNPPDVEFTPESGTTYTTSALEVTVNWSDRHGLDRDSALITLTNANGTNQPVEFDYSGGPTSAQSVVNLQLTPGTNTLTARIYDQAGNPSGSQSATYTYEVPPVYSVSVTPSSSSASAAPYAEGVRQTFTVRNTGNQDVTYNLRAQCTSTVSNCVPSPHQLSLPAGDAATVSVSFDAGAPGSTGTLELIAEQSDDAGVRGTGTVGISVEAEVGNTPVAPEVSVADANPGTTTERSLCLTLNMGGAGASECGDLRLAHALPTTRTLNKARTPVLLYNSQHAQPHPLVAAVVTLPEGGQEPDSVEAVLRVGSVERARQMWPGDHWRFAGDARRIVLGFDGLNDPAGLYNYTLEVTHWYGTADKRTVVSDTLVIVNRSQSPYGAGWWLAGLEEFNPATGLWIGGDGSTRRYVPVDDTTWVAERLDRPDTLKLSSGYYIRILPGKVYVGFNSGGQHVFTLNRLEHLTVFGYDGDRLSTITLPVPANAPPRVYTFAYDGNDKLKTVTAPSLTTRTNTVESRVTDLLIRDGRMLTIKGSGDPAEIAFAYWAESPYRIAGRRDRRGAVTFFHYDDAHQVSRTTVYLTIGSNPFAGDSLVTTVRSLGAQGLSPNTTDVEQGYALLDGPRTDVGDTTAFYLDRWGAPRRITNALGHTTELTRGDPRWPALVTRILHPNGRVVGAAYDDRGNVTSVTDSSTYLDGKYATTSYAYDDSAWPDFVTKITQPQDEFTAFDYDPATGNRLGRQDGRGVASRVSFLYDHPNDLLTDIQLPSTDASSPPAVEQIVYDAYGNLFTTTTPLGFVTEYHKDNLGRDTLTVSPIDSLQTLHQRQRITYEPHKDRTKKTETEGPAMNGAGTQAVVVENRYDEEGNLTRLTRRSAPGPAGIGPITTRWEYDAIGRAVKEIAPDGAAGSTVYDPAGNAVKRITRRGHTITMEYDARNRLTKRIVPEVYYEPFTLGIAASQWVRNDPDNPPYGGLAIPGSTSTFAYDEMGRITEADNPDAQVRRTYYPNGWLQTETQRIRTVAALEAGGSFGEHEYTLSYRYDRNGRRIALGYPEQLAPSGTAEASDRARYAYDPLTGQLSDVWDVLGTRFTYHFDARGGLDELSLPGGAREMKDTREVSLATDALTMALWSRKPARALLHHSDRGVLEWERFEDSDYHTHEEARWAVFDSIEVWYNRQRLHSSLDYRSPAEYEVQLALTPRVAA